MKINTKNESCPNCGTIDDEQTKCCQMLISQKEINRKEILRHLELDEKNLALMDVLEKAKKVVGDKDFFKVFLFDMNLFERNFIELKESISFAEKILGIKN